MESWLYVWILLGFHLKTCSGSPTTTLRNSSWSVFFPNPWTIWSRSAVHSDGRRPRAADTREWSSR